ncbi:MAG: formate dehydrogenase accessory sulfurtransferase FdhD [Nitrososphaerales archaeon]
MPASDTLLLLSGRASFELVQKAAIAGIPFICAVGPPSNLAIDLARDYGMSLIGFLKDNYFNIYSGNERVILSNNK